MEYLETLLLFAFLLAPALTVQLVRPKAFFLDFYLHFTRSGSWLLTVSPSSLMALQA